MSNINETEATVTSTLATRHGDKTMAVEAIAQDRLGLEPVALPIGGNGQNGWALEVRGASKVFASSPGLVDRIRKGREAKGKRVVAVDDVSLEVGRGEIFGILGPNGTGKSTLIRLISTLLIPDEGEIFVFGRDVVDDEAEVKRMINRVSVEASFFKKLTPMENLMYAARLYRVDTAAARTAIGELLDRLGIEDRSIGSPMEDMSRGMQQKVAIARAFLSTPMLLLLDEPTTGLDPHSKRQVQAFVREAQEDQGVTVLLTTHDMYEADALCDRIAIIDQGRIVALDTPAGLKSVIRRNGEDPTLEDVFLELTGRQLKDDKE
jgi:ABC-2 type transport system ATP-binding protein